jgi:tetratricopeptide (TPR) repeat protein
MTVAELLDRSADTIEDRFQGQEETEAAIRLTIGDTYRALGKLEQALPQLQRSVAIHEQKLGADHPGTLTSKNNLAVLYQDQGKYAEAEPLCLEVLKQQEKRQGADHPDTLASKNNLASLYRAQRKYDRSEPLYKEAVAGAMKMKELGIGHPITQHFLLGQVGLYEEWGKPEKGGTVATPATRLRHPEDGP